MKNCVFCNALKNPLMKDYQIFYSDNDYLAMIVSHPETKGHFILFPRSHFSEMSEMVDSGKFFEKAVELAEYAIMLLGAKAYVLKLNNKIFKLDDDPLHVGHIHIHIVPRYTKDDLKSGVLKPATKEELSVMKDRLIKLQS